jgi:DNA-binding transcriptional LysR family regulator
VTNSASAVQAAVAGLGIATLMMYQVASHVADGSLKIVLAEHERAALPVQILHRQGRYGASKVRNFIDLLVASLRAERSLV